MKENLKPYARPVELLAPAGTWDALVAAIESGADAVYLGGKHFNMRMHRSDTNFDDDMLRKAISYAHSSQRRLYITINNLISSEELDPLADYLKFLEEIGPDAILVQDLAMLALKERLGISIPFHASIMMNTHNEHMIRALSQHGITRVVVSREMPLSELALLKERTGIEIEYFVHGDMCIAESGQCIHSGVLFGQSGNRGRCLKPCRWPYRLIDEESREQLDEGCPGPYKLALKDMCLYRHLPELIQSGVDSFKIEGRMRPADFIRRIVSTYRNAIDAYQSDPTGYSVNESGWKELYQNRARDFTTSCAFGHISAKDIGFTGEREPRFFSQAVPEAGFQDEILRECPPIKGNNEESVPRLSVRAGSIDAARAALTHGADAVYAGGEAFLPERPWTLGDYEEIISLARERGARLIIRTPRTTTARECADLAAALPALKELGPDGFLVSNLGALALVKKYTDLPVQADISFNVFNELACSFLMNSGIVMATASLELSFDQLRSMAERSPLPVEAIVHGAYESMISDHNLPAMSLPGFGDLDNPGIMERHYALLDKAGEVHPIRVDQFGRNHILFAKDLCLYPCLEKFRGLSSWRIEAQDYTPELTGFITGAYREAIDRIARGESASAPGTLAEIEKKSPRALGVGAFRFRQSKNSI